MDSAELDFPLPPELIAQEPAEPRDHARLLVCPLAGGPPAHRVFHELPGLLRPGDLLVFNRTRVIPARLLGTKDSGGAVEVLLVHPLVPGDPAAGWRCLVRGKVREGSLVTIAGTVLRVTACHDDGHRDLAAVDGSDLLHLADRHGHVPLPPYIQRADRPVDRERYQTVFADRPGSVAAPTAGLHFTPGLLDRLAAAGVERAFVDLAIGPGTFKPIDTGRVEDYRIHAEWCSCPGETVTAVAAARARGGRVIAVGTTAVRTLESATAGGSLSAYQGWTRLFLHPPARLRTVDGLITNFHLPRSSLIALVACLTGLDRLKSVYAEAVRERYRFFSYGDAMLIC